MKGNCCEAAHSRECSEIIVLKQSHWSQRLAALRSRMERTVEAQDELWLISVAISIENENKRVRENAR